MKTSKYLLKPQENIPRKQYRKKTVKFTNMCKQYTFYTSMSQRRHKKEI